jgi:hypothetical protein
LKHVETIQPIPKVVMGEQHHHPHPHHPNVVEQYQSILDITQISFKIHQLFPKNTFW